MKIQCDVCRVKEANVLCCADEAALCWICDQKVHSVNKVVGQHQRVPLSSSHYRMPKCDICQEKTGYFFCLEDRALLCRKCDIGIHTMNPMVSVHQRFFLSGVKVDSVASKPGPSLSQLDDFFGLGDFSRYNFMDEGSSKVNGQGHLKFPTAGRVPRL